MNAETPFVSGYQRRMQMIKDVIEDRTGLRDTDSTDLAGRILAAIDHIPEKVR